MQLQEEMQAVPPQPLVDPEVALEGLEELAPGTVVNGFRLVRQVGKGGYGEVWLAVSVHKRVHKPGRNYALKFALASLEEDAAADARAVREVQLLLQVAHPHVLRVLGHGRWPDPERGIHYTVLEWVEGGTLLEWSRKANPSLRQVVRLAQQLARAVQAAHEQGVVHRDIKPANVLVSAEHGAPFLADFGMGEAAGSAPLTPAGLPVGTHVYRSPEALAFSLRAGGAPYHFQPADDWYALGVTLYEVLTEVRPFPEAEGSEEHARNVARLRPVPPHVLNPRVPLALSRVVLRLLEKKPSRRYREGHALWAALDAVLAQEGAWDESVYPPGAPQEPGLTPSRYPTQLDEALAAQDVELAWAYACKHDDPQEEYREGRAVSLRNALLAAQSRPWPQALRSLRWGVAALVLVSAAAGVWAAWEPVRAALSPPASMSSPGSLPRAASAPRPSAQTPPPVPVASPAPEAVAETPPQLSVALMGATSQKEDSAVKTPQSPPPSQPVSTSDSKRALKRSRLAPVCVTSALVAGCTGIPVRPPPKECPAVAINSMEALKIEPGSSYAFVQIDVKGPPPADFPNITFREGPIVSRVIDIGGPKSDYLPVGSLLFGKVIPGGGDRFFIRYEEAQPAGSTERVPLCAIAANPVDEGLGLPKKEDSTDTAWNSYNGTMVMFVNSFSE
jgi:serine/threonine protein kinase